MSQSYKIIFKWANKLQVKFVIVLIKLYGFEEFDALKRKRSYISLLNNVEPLVLAYGGFWIYDSYWCLFWNIHALSKWKISVDSKPTSKTSPYCTPLSLLWSWKYLFCSVTLIFQYLGQWLMIDLPYKCGSTFSCYFFRYCISSQ